MNGLVRRLVFVTSLLVLAACAGLPTAIVPSPTIAAPTAMPPPSPTTLPTPATVPTPTALPVTTEATPTEASLFAPVTEADWQTGPAQALVTIVEYGCFQ